MQSDPTQPRDLWNYETHTPDSRRIRDRMLIIWGGGLASVPIAAAVKLCDFGRDRELGFALLVLWVILAAASIVTAVRVMRDARRDGAPAPRRLLWPGAASLLLFGLLIASSKNRNVGYIPCPSNMRRIGQALQFYAMTNGGRYPDHIETLIASFYDVPAKCFVCPSTTDQPAPGRTPQEQAANLARGRHFSYLYFGKGLTNACPPDTILLCEPLANHGGDGMYALFGDGHADWVQSGIAAGMLQELSDGHNPPRPDRVAEVNEARRRERQGYPTTIP